MKVPFSPPDMTGNEVEYVSEVLRSGWITTGPKTKLFEEKLSDFCGVRRTACLASATAAMELSLRLLGIGEGDEVITSAYTFTASAAVIDHVGARVVLVDTEKDAVFMSASALENAITEKTKAIIPVDIGGIPADYDMIKSVIEKKRNLFRANGKLQEGLGRIAIVADCAHSLGAAYKGKSVAQYADFACYSFHAVKNLTTAEGGAVCFGDVGGVSAEELYKEFMLFSLHGQSKDALAKTKLGAWEYDIVFPGYKCNMTDIMAAVGLAQLERYKELVVRRTEMVARYNAHFAGTPVKPLAHKKEDFFGSHHLYITSVEGISLEERNAIIIMMAEKGVSANVHYKPLPLLTAYKAMGYDIKEFPNAFSFYKNEITLPLHTLLTDEQIDFTAQTLLDAIAAVKG
ncbi:MAG: DegT/DnrJ/EryC1/StrS family aminotransferase [Ruminococcaceae bacterium]|nr:DegT/DnrJ/EryC1/StrS family aminotransferase [Oscillospiraceae bacterium]